MSYVNKDSKLHNVREVETIRDIINSSTELYGERVAFLNKDEKGGSYF